MYHKKALKITKIYLVNHILEHIPDLDIKPNIKNRGFVYPVLDDELKNMDGTSTKTAGYMILLSVLWFKTNFSLPFPGFF